MAWVTILSLNIITRVNSFDAEEKQGIGCTQIILLSQNIWETL